MILDKIENYLGNGGLFNPELMEHEKVRDLIMSCKEKIQKRDELLEKAKIVMLSWCDRNECDADDIHEWLKQYEELKK